MPVVPGSGVVVADGVAAVEGHVLRGASGHQLQVRQLGVIRFVCDL